MDILQVCPYCGYHYEGRRSSRCGESIAHAVWILDDANDDSTFATEEEARAALRELQGDL